MCADGGAEAGEADAAAEPDFAVVCSFLALAGDACAIEPVPFPELLAYLHDPDEVSTYLVELFCKLLRRAVKSFRPNYWEKYLIKFCNQRGHRQDAWELERFGYKKSNVRVKLRVLKTLLEYQFVCNTKFKNAINKMDNPQLRLTPIGRDDKGRCYWLQTDHRANLRLYREDQDEETWKLVANGRAGLVEIINALKSGKYLSDSIVEPVLNEDSNSVESAPVPTVQTEETDNDIKESSPLSSVKPIIETDDDIPKNDSDSPKTSTGTIDKSEDLVVSEASNGKESQAKDEESTVTEDIKNNSENSESSKLDVDCKIDNETIDTDNHNGIVGEEIEEKVMIIKGDGNGADCESMPNYFFSEEIEEDVMYIFGYGNGHDCMTGNPGVDAASSNAPEAQTSEPIDNGEVESSTSDGNVVENVLNSKNGDHVDDIPTEIDIKSNSKSVGDTENDLETKGGPSASLPFTKRFLQNIPKPQAANVDSNSPSKIKLWSVDSFCTSSSNEQTSDNCANTETVLEDKTRIVNNECADTITSNDNGVNETTSECGKSTNDEPVVHSQSITDSDLVKCDNNAITSSEHDAANEPTKLNDKVSETEDLKSDNLSEATNVYVKHVEDDETVEPDKSQGSTDCIESIIDNDQSSNQSNNVEGEHKINEIIDSNIEETKENLNIEELSPTKHEDHEKSDIELNKCQEKPIESEELEGLEESVNVDENIQKESVESIENIAKEKSISEESPIIECQKLDTKKESIVEENTVEDKSQEICADSEKSNTNDEPIVEDSKNAKIIDSEKHNETEVSIVEDSANNESNKQDEKEESLIEEGEDQEKSIKSTKVEVNNIENSTDDEKNNVVNAVVEETTIIDSVGKEVHKDNEEEKVVSSESSNKDDICNSSESSNINDICNVVVENETDKVDEEFTNTENQEKKCEGEKDKIEDEPIAEETINTEKESKTLTSKESIIDKSVNIDSSKENVMESEANSKERIIKSRKCKAQVETNNEEKAKGGKLKGKEETAVGESTNLNNSKERTIKSRKCKAQVETNNEEKAKGGKHKAKEESVNANLELNIKVKKAKTEEPDKIKEEPVEAHKSSGENSNLKVEDRIKREECNSQSDDSGISMKKIKTGLQEESKKTDDIVVVKHVKHETMKLTVQLKKMEMIDLETKAGVRTRRSGALINAKLAEVVKESEVKLEKLVMKGGKRTRGADNNVNNAKPKIVKKEEAVENKVDEVEKEDLKKVDKIEKEEEKKEKVTRKRARDKTESESEEEIVEPQKNKKIKMRQKKVNTAVRKKVEEQKMAEESSDEDESETPIKGKLKNIVQPKDDSPPEITEKKVVKKKGRKKKVKGSKPVESEQPVDDTPVRQSRRIAQLKIKEEAQRRLMEEMALREMKEQHKKKNNKSKDEDWQDEASEHSSEGAIEVVKIKEKKKHKKLDNWHKKQLGWNSSSGGNDSDSEPGNEPEDDFDEQEEEDILAPKSDHEFSPESDIESSDVVPIRRARTLKKDDGEVPQDAESGCTQCGKNDHPEWILLCDSCDAGWHASCLKPVLFLVPEGQWFCPPCNHKSLITALEGALDDYDKLVERVKDADLEKKMKSDESADASEYNSDNSDDNNSEANSSESNSSESSNNEKIYRLRERRQLPVSYRFKEYDQLISSAIKEEYKEVDNSGAGNMGRGKDISTIIEADLEEKKAMAEAIKETGDENMPRPRQPKARRRPRKLNSLEVVSDDCDDNSDEDFKETACSSSSSEAISSNESANSSSSRSSDSLPIRRSSRPTNSKHSRRRTPERKKKRRRIIDSDDDTAESDASSIKEWETKKKKKSSRRSRKRMPGSSRRRKKEKKEGGEDDGDDTKPIKQRAKVKYGGLSDSSRSSHDWSPAHRTRQKKYNYMEMPNTESEEEAHKPSGKHMDSSDEYKGESDSGSDSDSSGNKKQKSRFFDEDIQNMQADKEAYQKKESDEMKGSLVPTVKLNDESPVITDGALQTDDNVQTNEETISTNDLPITIATAVVTTPVKIVKTPNRARRGGKPGSSPRKNLKKVIDKTPVKECDPIQGDGMEIGGDGETLNIPIKCVIMTPFQMEREKKRKEKEEKMREKEIRKEERLKKKEEKLMVKEQRAKEREEKKLAKQASMEQRGINRKVIRPEYQPGQQIFTNPIPILRGPGVFPPIRQPYPPHMGPGGPNIRGPMPPNMNQPHMNIRPYMQGPPREGPPPLVPMDNRDQIIHHRPLIDTQIKSERADTDESQGYSPHPEDRKSVLLSLDKPPQLINLESIKAFPGGPRSIHEGLRGMSPNLDNQSSVIRPPMPGYPMDERGIPMMRGNMHIRPNDNHNDMVSRNGIPISDMSAEHRQLSPHHLSLSAEEAKRRGRGPGKKTLARQVATNLSTDGSSPSPSSSPIIEGTLAVAGAPQPFRPNVDPPSVITRMPHIMPPPYRGSSVFNNSIPMYGAPRLPPNHLMGGSFRPHHPHPLDPSPSGGGPISMASPDRSSPQRYSPYPPQAYYPPGSTPPQLGPYPPPHGRFPPHLNAPSSRSPTPHNTPETTEEVKSKARDTPEPVPFIKSEIKEEPNTDKQSSSPTEELEVASEKPTESEHSAASPPPARPAHPRLKHTENKSRGRIALTTAARYPQGPYAPQYGPYAPPHHPPTSETSYLHQSLHPIHSNHPQPHMSQIHRPIYPSPHLPPSHMTPIQLPPRPPAAQAERSDEAPNPPSTAGVPPPPNNTTGEDEPSEFGGLVSYFSSQREDDIDT